METIAFESVQDYQLDQLIAIAPARLNELSKFILAERPLMLKPLEAAANALGWHYAPDQVWLRRDTAPAPEIQLANNLGDDEDAEMLAEQIGLNAAAAVVEAPAAPAQAEPIPAATMPSPRARKPKAAAAQKPWPWPKSGEDEAGKAGAQ